MRFKNRTLLVREKWTTNFGSGGRVVDVKLSDKGEFQSEVELTDSTAYLSFEFEDENLVLNENGKIVNVSVPTNMPLVHAFLFQKGDSIRMDIRKNGMILFSGRGSEKLTCQWEVHNTPIIPESINSRLSGLYNERKFDAFQKLTIQSVETSLELRRAILKSYKGRIAESLLKQLWIDAVSVPEYVLLQSNYNMHRSVKNKSVFDDTFLKAEEKWFKAYVDNVTSDEFAHSAYYAELIVLRESYRLKIAENLDTGSSVFQDLYQKIVKDYSGDLRDKLIFTLFETMIDRSSTEAQFIFKDALVIIMATRYRNLLQELGSRKFSAFPFEFYDAMDKAHRLKDYKGKVLVLDFWFTGCLACTYLNKAMHPIVQRYKGNNDVLFLTISTDPKANWLRSVASGIYTSPGTIDLHTNGLGYNHPFIKNYGIRSAPRQFIIGKDGKLVTISPPSPYLSDHNSKRFQELLDRLINK